MSTATSKQAIINYLEGLSSGEVEPIQLKYGICYHLYSMFRFRSVRYVEFIPQYLCKEWPEWSGDTGHPIVHPDHSAREAFYLCEDLWSGEYGASRKRLCKFLAEELEKMPDDTFEHVFINGNLEYNTQQEN